MDKAGCVRQANKEVYNAWGDSYEAIDGRRSGELVTWLTQQLRQCAEVAPSPHRLLDLGCGGGFVASAAKGIFTTVYGVDIADVILRPLIAQGNFPVCSLAEKLPFVEESVDAVTLFAALHHFFEYQPIIDEVYRVLRPGGVVYIDHDMDRAFFRQYRPFINLYRFLFRSRQHSKGRGVDRETYALSEFHSQGVDSSALKAYLQSKRFSLVADAYHWYGLSPMTNRIFKHKTYSQGHAPLISIIAQKET